jgi:hypothetical protein
MVEHGVDRVRRVGAARECRADAAASGAFAPMHCATTSSALTRASANQRTA